LFVARAVYDSILLRQFDAFDREDAPRSLPMLKFDEAESSRKVKRDLGGQKIIDAGPRL
jgi:hypothetical protein